MIKELAIIYFLFFKMGAVTFGGGYAMLPILRREIVENHKWLSEETIIDFYAISQGLPGIITVNVSVLIGYSRRKIPGAIAATLGAVSPCVIIITIIAASLSNFQNNMYVKQALSAVSVCVCALILESLIAMWKKGVKDIAGYCFFAFTLVCMTFTSISPILLVIISGTLGVTVKKLQEGKTQ